MRVTTLLSTSFFAKYLHVVEDAPGRGHLCHTVTFLVYYETSLFGVEENGESDWLLTVATKANNKMEKYTFMKPEVYCEKKAIDGYQYSTKIYID